MNLCGNLAEFVYSLFTVCLQFVYSSSTSLVCDYSKLQAALSECANSIDVAEECWQSCKLFRARGTRKTDIHFVQVLWLLYVPST